VKIAWQFVLGSGLSSRLISWWGNGYGGYSHVDAILPDGTCLGARSDQIGLYAPGVQIRAAGYEHWKKRCVATLEVTPQIASAWETYLLSQVGKEYDKGNIVDFITGAKPADDSGQWICSALQCQALEVSGCLAHPLPTPPQQVTPNTLLDVISALGAIFQSTHET
jgi:hypothetical protein